MEWIKELLKDVVEEDKLEGLVTKINTEAPKYIVPKNKYNELSEEKKNLEAEISNRDTQLETLKGQVGSDKELQEKITQLENENKVNKEKYEADLINNAKRNAVELSLVKNGAVNSKACMPFIDLEKIEYENGEVKGVDDLIGEMVKGEDASFLFAPNKINGMKVVSNLGGNNPPANNSEVQKIAEKQNESVKEAQDPWA